MAKFCVSYIYTSFRLSLQSNDNDERLQVVKLLAKMFGAKDSELAAQNKPLWQCYLGRWVWNCQKYPYLMLSEMSVCPNMQLLFVVCGVN